MGKCNYRATPDRHPLMLAFIRSLNLRIPTHSMTTATPNDRLKVFISYSRRDSGEFADELLAGLELAGFSPFLDRHDIAAGEEWETRLGALIRQADTVVYVISPESVKSPRCEWEVEKAIAEAKRVLPVIFKSVADADIPAELQRRQFIHFDTGPGITRPLAQLADALRQDLDWIREHTRLGELAQRWDGRDRPASLLLRSDDLIAAQAWADRWKPGAPAVTDVVQRLITASKTQEALDRAQSMAVRRRMRWTEFLAAACGLAAFFAIVGWWQQSWLKQEFYALENVQALTAAHEHTLKPQSAFKECTDCPDMVVLPAGSFVMGSPPTDPARKPSEGPQRTVTIATPFAVSKFEVTFAQWDACAANGPCNRQVSDGGFGRGQQPVVNVTWSDAERYVAWLSAITGKSYRLLSEAEYEYAARGGTTTTYPWGDTIGTNNANCAGCGSQWDGRQPAPVGSFSANPFGLYDMIGNVWEWTADCAHATYDGAPQDGSSWVDNNGCTSRVARGGSWNVVPASLRSADRLLITAGSLYFNLGFRVARTLSAP
jgi:formylglycine-generating enzyme required for sulfatase activity